MWNEIAANLPEFASGVLNVVDDGGYPTSVRCRPVADGAAQVIRLALPENATLPPGPASLLCHRHDEWLWNLKSFLVRGELERDERGWLLRPTHFIPGTGLGGLRGFLRFIRSGRRTAQRYLEKRGLERPRIAWDELKAAWAEVVKEE